jgi:hypothetical protein
MLMRLFSVEFRLLAHGAGPEMVIFRKNDISLAGRLFLLGIGPSHNALNNQQINYLSVNFLCLFKALVHSFSNGIVIGRGIVLGQGLILELGLGAFALFVVNRSVRKVIDLTLDLLFGLDSQVVRLGSFLSMWRLSDLDQIAGF